MPILNPHRPAVSASAVVAALSAKRRLIDTLRTLDRTNWNKPLRDFSSMLVDSGVLEDTAVANVVLQDVGAELDALLWVEPLIYRDRVRSFDHKVRLALCSVSPTTADAITIVLEANLAASGNQAKTTLWHVTRYLEEHFAERCTINRLTESVGLSRGTISTLFRDHMQMTIHDYLTDLRMTKAQRLISEGVKIEAVGLIVGYRSKRSFYKQFRNRTGMTPLAFRSRTTRTGLPVDNQSVTGPPQVSLESEHPPLPEHGDSAYPSHVVNTRTSRGLSSETPS